MNRKDQNAQAILALPSYLRSWAKHLGWLNPELMPDLTKLIQPLANTLKHFLQPSLIGETEPDGYDGVIRKGIPERLLLSEWALADIFPEEFLRRVSMQEQLYYAPKQNIQKNAQQMLLLLDCGPFQWGAPRLAHLATLIILSRIALEQNAILRWAPLQQPDCDWQEGVGEKTLKFWLKTHTVESLDQANIDRWKKRLDEEMLNSDESPIIWGIGSHFLKKYDVLFSGIIYCEEPIKPEFSNTLDITVRYKNQQKQFALSLPDSAIQTQLLRHPLAIKKPKASRQSAEQEPFNAANDYHLSFTLGGRYLIVRHPMVRINILKTPNEFNYGGLYREKTRKFDQGFHPILGCDKNEKRLFIAQLCKDHSLSFNLFGSWRYQTEDYLLSDKTQRSNSTSLPVIDKNGWLYCTWWQKDKIIILDAHNTLWLYEANITASKETRFGDPPRKIATNVLYFTKIKQPNYIYFLKVAHQRLVWHSCNINQNEITLQALSDERFPIPSIDGDPTPLPDLEDTKLHIQIYTSEVSSDGIIIFAIAYKDEKNHWVVISQPTSSWISDEPMNNIQVIGILNNEHQTKLLCYEENYLFSLFKQEKTKIRYFTHPPKAMTYCTETDTLAWVDKENNIHFILLKTERDLLTISLDKK